MLLVVVDTPYRTVESPFCGGPRPTVSGYIHVDALYSLPHMNSAHEKRKCAPFLPSPPPFGTSTTAADICPIQICIGERSHSNSPSDLDLLLRQTGLDRSQSHTESALCPGGLYS